LVTVSDLPENDQKPKTDHPAENGDTPVGCSASGAPDGYKVENKRPPRHSQFRPGQSGNPKGRPPKSRNLKNDLLDELSERIRIREGDRHRRVSKQQALLKALVNRGLGGDVRAIASVFGMVARLIYDTTSEAEQALEASDTAIIEDFIARRLASQSSRKGPAASSHGDQENINE
jgi:hypothetical protein